MKEKQSGHGVIHLIPEDDAERAHAKQRIVAEVQEHPEFPVMMAGKPVSASFRLTDQWDNQGRLAGFIEFEKESMPVFFSVARRLQTPGGNYTPIVWWEMPRHKYSRGDQAGHFPSLPSWL